MVLGVQLSQVCRSGLPLLPGHWPCAMNDGKFLRVLVYNKMFEGSESLETLYSNICRDKDLDSTKEWWARKRLADDWHDTLKNHLE